LSPGHRRSARLQGSACVQTNRRGLGSEEETRGKETTGKGMDHETDSKKQRNERSYWAALARKAARIARSQLGTIRWGGRWRILKKRTSRSQWEGKIPLPV